MYATGGMLCRSCFLRHFAAYNISLCQEAQQQLLPAALLVFL